MTVNLMYNVKSQRMMILKLREIADLMNRVCGTNLDVNELSEEYNLTEEEQKQCLLDEERSEDTVDE